MNKTAYKSFSAVFANPPDLNLLGYSNAPGIIIYKSMDSEVSGFDFPNKLRVGMKFSSISSINQYLKEEAR